MNISLIEVPESKITLNHDGKELVLSGVRTNYPKQSPLIVAGILRNHADVKIIDMKIMYPTREELYKEFQYDKGIIRCYMLGASFDSINNEIEKSDIIGITSNFTRSSQIVMEFINHAKKINPGVKVIVGGSDATARPEHYLINGTDFVILGEGECSGPKLIEALKNNRLIEEITGIAYKTKNIITLNRRPLSDHFNIDHVPFPAFDLIKGYLSEYNEAFEGKLPQGVNPPIGIIETSRGCTNICDFCATPNLRGGYRFMTTRRLEELLDHYKKNGINTLVIMEDNILARLTKSRGRTSLIEMFTLLKEKGFAWEFGNGIEFCKLKKEGKIDEELISLLFRPGSLQNGKISGCYRALIPLETLQNHPEQAYAKLRPLNEEMQIIRSIIGTGLKRITFGIVIGRYNGNPNDLHIIEKEAESIIKICEDAKVQSYFALYIYVPTPGSSGYNQMKDFCLYSIVEYPELYQFWTSPFKTNAYSPKELTLAKLKLEQKINGVKIDRLLYYGKYDN